MTLCIAAVCHFQGETACILCSDTKLDQGEWGASKTAIKVHGLGHNMFSMIAGGWIIGVHCSRHISLYHSKEDSPKDQNEVLYRMRRHCEDFLRVYSSEKNNFSLLLSGFIGREHVMIRADVTFDTDGTSYLFIKHLVDWGAVGEGEYAAQLLMKHRGYDPHNMGIDRACYLVYEAKKFAETVGSVGVETRMAIHSIVKFPPNFVLPQGNLWVTASVSEPSW